MLVNVFLIRAPEAVLASYTQKWDAVSLDAIGVPMQAALFEREADRLGQAPPVIDAADVARRSRAALLGALCRACGIPFDRAHAVLAGRPARQRRRLGAGLVRRGRALDRLCRARRCLRRPRACRDDLRSPSPMPLGRYYERLKVHALTG